MINWNLSKLHTKFLALAMGFWIIGDLVTTWAFLSVGHLEGNPLFFWLSVETFWIMIPIKVVAGLLVILGINHYAKPNKSNHPIHKTFKPVYLIHYFFGLGFFASLINLIGVLQ